MENHTEKAYTTKEVATRLHIAVPTVRKYAQSLETEQYKFIRSESGARIFVENDINAFHYFMELRKANISVEASSKIVVEKFKGGAIQDVSGSNTPQLMQYNKQYEELKEMVHKQNDLIKELSNKLDQQQDYIKNSLDKRDKHLMQLMNDISEQKKELAATTEIQDNKPWYKKLFNKN
ncbi:hypothetical protein GCM10011409_45370 [Lentibacillus populi]|uniref:HTH merR-type domain-containing protein n=1 Tax=Lentibacillus populi TaxID=1827502 RepID=A0A9W5U2I1_9BACI|nr:MerR family transcriptional regulator [Lentibacillus populi]GGB63207.1 hypothetical protein GCM10011409_45370 [Lentibacillus populi]